MSPYELFVAGVFVIDHANQASTFSRGRTAAGQIAGDSPANLREGAAEGDYPVILVLIPDGAPVGVIAILLRSAGITSSYLEVSRRIRTNPNVLPSRGNGRPSYSFQLLAVANRLSSCAKVAE